MEIVFSLEELPSAANSVLDFAADETIWIFDGEMGSGKTTFIKEICTRFAVGDDVSSPTFSIVNEYPGEKGKIYHFDLYRLKNERELIDIGFEEYLDSGDYCFIEWPQKAMPFLPLQFLEISIEALSNTDRRLMARHIKQA